MISLGGLVNQKAFGKFEMGKVISNPFATAFKSMNERVDMNALSDELKRLIKKYPGKQITYSFITNKDYPKGYVFFINGKILKEAEGSEDHEVSMAQNQLDSIIKSATELKQKMGEEEKQIPAWIQDHITNAENFISQASSNYHEYGDSNEEVNEAPAKTTGERIQNLNNRIKALKDKMAATKSPQQKNLIQQRLKNALQSLSNIKKDHSIKAPHREGVTEIKFDKIRVLSKEEFQNEAGPCWKGYKQVGMKDKGGKQVPNCVPNESVVKEISARAPKLFVKIAAVEKKIKELLDDRKKAVVPYNNEKDPKKKEILKQILIKLTNQIKGYEKNLIQLRDMEQEYIQQMDADAELDLAAMN